MHKGWMNSYAKFGGAARRHFSAICEKPMGGHICAPPSGCARVKRLILGEIWRQLSERVFQVAKS